MVCTRLRFELISRGDGVATDADVKPQKNVPQAEHMPHVMPRARSSKSSGRVRQIKQRSAELTCGCGCWCSGAVWVDGWAAFARVSGCRLWFFNGCAACGEAWMLAAASGVVTAASMLSNAAEMQFCARTRGLPLASRLIPDKSEFKNGNTPLSRRHVSVGRPETCWSERRPRHCDRGPRRPAAVAEAILRRRPRRATRESCP